MPEGHIASPLFFPGASAQNRISNGKRILLKLVKSLENLRKFKNCKLNFARFLVRSTTTFVILT
jgi:hypothetical protein